MQDKLQSYRERYTDFTDHFAEQRKRMLEDLKFSNPADPQQWDDATRKARENAPGGKRPTLTFDHTNQYINQVVNDARQNKPGIQVLPVDSNSDVKVAEILEGLIRHIEYSSRANIAYDTSIDHAARCGVGWMRVTTEVVNERMNEQEVRIKNIHDPLSCMISPESIEPDGSDAVDGFVETMMSKRAFEKAYGKKVSQTSWDGGQWFNDNSIRVCEYYKLITTKNNRLDVQMPDGTSQTLTEEQYWEFTKAQGFQPIVTAQWTEEEKKVEWCLMTGDDIIDETVILSKWIPLVPVYGDILWVDGKRYICGMTRKMMDAQRARNFERSAQIELAAMQPRAPFILPFESVENFESEWASPSNKNYLPYNALDAEGRPLPAPQRLNPPTMSPAFDRGAMNAGDDMQAAIGMYKSNLGAPSNAVSGRAKMQDQREGDTATYHYVDNQSRAIEHVARIIINMIPQYYNTQREIRILGLNGDTKAARIEPNGDTDLTGDMPVINLATGTFDVRVKTGPAYATLRQEASQALTEIVSKSPELMAVLGPTWARMQDWPESDKVAKLLMSMAPPQVQALEQEDNKLPPEAQGIVANLKAQLEQMQQQLQEAGQAADQNITQAQQNQEQNQIAREKNQISMFEAETKRLVALKPQDNAPDTSMTDEHKNQIAMFEAETKRLALIAGIDSAMDKVNSIIQIHESKMASIPVPESQPETEEDGQVESVEENNQMQAMMAEHQNTMLEVYRILAELNEKKTKIVSMQAPSGAVYTGTVETVQ